jgi:hypothetical protein
MKPVRPRDRKVKRTKNKCREVLVIVIIRRLSQIGREGLWIRINVKY